MTSASLQRPAGLLPLWFGLLGGPLAWTLQLLGGYFLVSVACVGGFQHPTPLFLLLSAAMALVTLAAGLTTYRLWRASGVGGATDQSGPVARGGFMALSGLLTSGLFLLGIAFGTAGFLVLDPCGRVG